MKSQNEQFIKDYLKMHCKKFNYAITKAEEDEIALIYNMNNYEFDKSSLILHIERFIANLRSKENTSWKILRRASVSAKKMKLKELNFFKSESTIKSESTKTLLLQALSKGLTKDILTAAQINKLVEYMVRKSVESKKVFIKEGSIGAEMYIIEKGEFNVFVNGKLVSKLKRGSSFGEIALLHLVPRTATVVAVKDSIVWEISQDVFSAVRFQDRMTRKMILKESLIKNKIFDSEMKIESACSDCLYKSISTGEWVGICKEKEIAIILTNGMIRGDCDMKVATGDIIENDFTAITELEVALVDI